MTIDSRLIEESVRDVLPVRHQLHRNPELAFELPRTRKLVRAKLEEYGLEVYEIGYGLVAEIVGRAPGPRIGLRADMDALPIHEMPAEGKTVMSEVPGKMHGCGHDGHTAILLGAAKYLAATRNFAGRILLVFQANEENTVGAEEMIKAGVFKRFPCEAIYGYHNWPPLAPGKFSISAGPILAGSWDFRIDISGRGGHGGITPSSVYTPEDAGVELVQRIRNLGIEMTKQTPDMPVVARAPTIRFGEGAPNVIASKGFLVGTFRAFSEDTLTSITRAIEIACSELESAHSGLSIKPQFMSHSAPVTNSVASADLMRKVAERVVGTENVVPFPRVTGAEDFGAFIDDVGEGAMIAIGQGGPHLHADTYGFNDDILPKSIEFLVGVAEARLSLEGPAGPA